ncbi:M-phase phosphoprotein 6 [Leguminivora glycinivorella]|uniref:M-phase phosphoprotein 6 n=1 Tax=Leguminivora glycinivorella TaxID=1035111 RepID=UPI00200E045A|nr:M-phase phosphoprotein 6 [Leguminivora glycinivorella]
MDRSKKKLQLPKSVLDMKFMRKTKERIEKELENTQDHENLYSNIITDEMRTASGNYVSESSFIFCEDLLEGRLSFKGMNPEIERLMRADKNEDSDDGEMQKDISDDILAKKMDAFHKRKRESSDKKPQGPSNKKKRFHEQPKKKGKNQKINSSKSASKTTSWTTIVDVESE